MIAYKPFLLKSGIALFIFFISGYLSAQNKEIDSLRFVLSSMKNDSNKVESLISLSRKYFETKDFNQALQYANESLLLSQNLKYRKGEANAFHWLGTLNRDLNNIAEARKNYHAAINIRAETGDSSMADVYLDISRSFIMENNFPEGIKNTLKALELNEKDGDRYSMARTYRRLGYNYMSYGNINEAIRHYTHSAVLLEEFNKKKELAVVQGILSRLHLMAGNDSLAAKYILSALDYLKNEKDKEDIAFSKSLAGRFYLTESKIESAKKNYTAARKKLLLAEKNALAGMDYYETNHRLSYDRASSVNVLGEIYLELNDLSKARYYLERGNRLNLETKNKLEIQASYLNLYRLDRLQGNYRNALDNFKQYIVYRDSIASTENTSKMENAAMQYAFNKKEDSLKQRQLVTQVKLEAQQQQEYLYWIGLGLLGLLSFFVYKNFRNQKKLNRLADEAHAREKAELELHSLRAQLNPHFMFNSLNAIQELILMEENEKSQTYLARFAKLLRMLLENAENPFIPLQRELDFLQLYLSLENLRIPDLQHSIQVDKGINTEKVIIPNMILQPYIENAIWHGLSHKEENKKLSISISRQNGFVAYGIEDNGVGRKKAEELKSLYRKEHKSKGMELLSKRFKLLAKEFGSDIEATYADVMDKGEVAGTRVTIKVPKEFSGK